MNLPDISAFGYSLFALLAATSPESTNILISPFSIASALALALAGATIDSTCQKEMLTTLNISSHEQLPALSEQMLASTKGDNPSVTLTSADGIWSKELKTTFVDTIRNTHGAEVNNLPDTYGPIDEFIKNKTNGLIPKMFGDGPIDNLVVAILVNVVYFKGGWTTQFDKNNTKDASFVTFDGETHEAKFMNRLAKVPMAMNVKQLNGAHVVQLDYGEQMKDPMTDSPLDADFIALFVLPAEEGKQAMDDVIKSLTSMQKSSLGSVMDQMGSFRKVALSLPRFKLEYGAKSLKEGLKSLGIKEAFEGQDIFSEMSTDPDVHINDVLHKAALEVTEEGTEAAAATGVIMMTRSANIPMVFDRPFLMIILHQPTSTPMFIAQVAKPDFI